MCRLRTNKRRFKRARVGRLQRRPARWWADQLSDQLKDRLLHLRIWVLGCLEGLDKRLSNRQRKWLFYLGLLFWSGFLLYLLGTAIRTPPSSFVLPYAADSIHARLKLSK